MTLLEIALAVAIWVGVLSAFFVLYGRMQAGYREAQDKLNHLRVAREMLDLITRDVRRARDVLVAEDALLRVAHAGAAQEINYQWTPPTPEKPGEFTRNGQPLPAEGRTDVFEDVWFDYFGGNEGGRMEKPSKVPSHVSRVRVFLGFRGRETILAQPIGQSATTLRVSHISHIVPGQMIGLVGTPAQNTHRVRVVDAVDLDGTIHLGTPVDMTYNQGARVSFLVVTTSITRRPPPALR